MFPPGEPATLLGPSRRMRDLDRLASRREPFDVLVVGGGVTGAGVALDAASRGLSVLLVDAHDLAFGTSRWSSKLAHGGLRYLAHGDVAVAAESAVERGLVMERIAPHLSRALPTLVPYGSSAAGWAVSGRAAGLVDLGARAGDALRRYAGTSSRTLPPPRRVGTAESAALVPRVRRSGLQGGVLWWDGQLEDDARFVVALARTAAGYGATILTHTRALSVGDHTASLQEARTGQALEVSARAIVNATGVWAGALDPSVQLRPSKGVHLVLDGASLGHPAAAVAAPVPGSTSRYVFALPHPDGQVYLGLTDDPLDGPIPDVPSASADDVTFLLGTINQVLQPQLTPDDVVGSYAGLRPLLAAGEAAGSSSDISRKHAVIEGPGGLVTVTGGKFTTYRKMAQDVVDRLTDMPCRTRDIGLVGAGPVDASEAAGLPPRLVRKYGTEAPLVAGLARDRPELLAPVDSARPELGVELAWGRYAEGAATVDDLLERRTRMSLVSAVSDRVRPTVEGLLGGEG